jgi:hypothetical protein
MQHLHHINFSSVSGASYDAALIQKELSSSVWFPHNKSTSSDILLDPAISIVIDLPTHNSSDSMLIHPWGGMILHVRFYIAI